LPPFKKDNFNASFCAQKIHKNSLISIDLVLYHNPKRKANFLAKRAGKTPCIFRQNLQRKFRKNNKVKPCNFFQKNKCIL